MKNYFGISRDHSGSMGHIAVMAARDYNDNIAAIRENAISNNLDTIISVVKCGVGQPAKNLFETINSNILAVQPLDEKNYGATGSSTPLFDSVNMLIESMLAVPDANDESVSFLIMVVTDGQDNSSKMSGRALGEKIRQLQSTDRWTFAFRVPRGEKHALVRLGIPEWNILEWEQSAQGVQAASAATRSAVSNYFTARSTGAKSTTKFYADMSNVTPEQVKEAMTDISSEVVVWPVMPSEAGAMIRDYCEKRLGQPLLKGAAFYELTKTEPHVQDYKMICIRDRSTGAVYSGRAARDMLGMPQYGDIRLAPGAHAGYDIFIQSTSVNRKLPAGSQVLYWSKVGKAFTEGPSAR